MNRTGGLIKNELEIKSIFQVLRSYFLVDFHGPRVGGKIETNHAYSNLLWNKKRFQSDILRSVHRFKFSAYICDVIRVQKQQKQKKITKPEQNNNKK